MEHPYSKDFKGLQEFLWLSELSFPFCEGLQKLLKPITDLIRQAAPFVWGEA